jgi:hypothetical protein
MSVPNSEIDLLLHQLALAFDRRSWHGTNLLGSVRGVAPELAGWRPQPGRHNIAELTAHAAYWKYRVRRQLTDAPPRSFELRGSNFFARPDPLTHEEWQGDVDLLKRWHERLVDAASRFDPSRLSEQVGSTRFTFRELILGIASHDLYHAGQIQLIKRMHEG